MRHWKITNFLLVALSIHLLTLVLVGIGDMGINVPVLRQIICFIDLTFIPGLLFLRIMRLNRLQWTEKLLFSVGLSLSFVMFMGLLVNSLYPYIGIVTPISTWSILGTVTVALLALGFLTYKTDKGSTFKTKYDWHQISSPYSLFFISLPLISILGALFVNVYHNNIILLLLIPLLAIIPALIAFTNSIPHKLYPLALVTVAIALLFHVSLISNYLTGFDIHVEYYFANLVQTSSVWNTTIPNAYNSMLSIVMIGPIYSLICGIELTWVFKVIYPLLFALVPLGVYTICNKQLNGKISFLAAFFFMSLITYFTVLISLARQEIAEVFLVLILLVIVSKSLSATIQQALLLIFASSLILSHYSISYIFIVLMLIVLIISFMKQIISRSRIAEKVSPKIVNHNHLSGNTSITLNFVAFFFVVCVSWYMWQSSSSAVTGLMDVIKNIGVHFLTEFMSIFSSEALWLIATPTVTPLHELNKYLHLLVIFLICIGIFDLLLRWKNKELDEEFSILAIVSFIIVAAAIPIPYLAIALNTERLYQITLIFLAPFFILGVIASCKLLARIPLWRNKISTTFPIKIASIIVVIFILFNTHFLYLIAGAHPNSISLSADWVKHHGNAQDKLMFYSDYMPEQDVFGAKWLSINTYKDSEIYANYFDKGSVHPLMSYGMMNNSRLSALTIAGKLNPGAYVYLQYLNIIEGLAVEITYEGIKQKEIFSMDKLRPFIEKNDKIYANGGSEIFYVQN